MKQKGIKKIISLILLLCIILTMSLSVLFLIKGSNHECIGTNCQVCISLHSAGKTLTAMGASSAISIMGIIFLSTISILCKLLIRNENLRKFSLVSMKVRLDN